MEGSRIPDFETKSADLILLEDMMENEEQFSIAKIKSQENKRESRGDIEKFKKSKTKFDRNKAIKKGFNKNSIDLASEMTDFNNFLIANPGLIATAKPDKYPLVKKFFEEATAKSKEGSFKVDITKSSAFKNNGEIKTIALEIVSEREGAAMCGYWGNPKPTKGKDWYQFNNISNPEQALRSWGYHKPPSGLGSLGWTRARTWNEYMCGDNTFRDNAMPNVKWQNGQRVYSYNSLHEQNYSGWSPNGEPNPEVWTNWWWPYTIWPSYVNWWHSNY
jgi:hypothetical protein